MAEAAENVAKAEKRGVLTSGQAVLIFGFVAGVAILAAFALFSLVAPARADGPAPTDAKNVQTVTIGGHQVLVFDVNHNGTDLICTRGGDDDATSCIKR